METAAQILSIIGMICNILVFQQKTHKKVLIWQFFAATVFAASYFMLGTVGVCGGMLNVVGAIRSLVFLFKEKTKANSVFWLVFFILAFSISYPLTFLAFGKEPTPKNFIIELLPVIAMIIATVTLRLGSAKAVRRFGLISSPMWLIYNCFSGLYGAIGSEILNLISIIVGIIRLDLRKKNKESKSINLKSNGIDITIDKENGVISDIKIGNHAFSSLDAPIFVIRLRDKDGSTYYVDSTKATIKDAQDGALIYSGFGDDFDLLCSKVISSGGEKISWEIEITSVPENYAIEWVEFPKICLPKLIDNDPNGGKILFPYDEGILLTNETLLPRYEPEFPMSGAYFIFPNKVQSQFISYHFKDVGIYIGASDKERGFKGVDFYPYNDKLVLQMRLYSGADFGKDYKPGFSIVWQACTGEWKSAAEIYRTWFEENLPNNLVPIKENKNLPKWYEGSPLIVTYPVRGVHDMDKMEPNALFPYTNALPILNKIKDATNAQIMALLMHWEGTAPWAPPYVWPPFGGTEIFDEFKDALHKNGDLLGVYCSGFGYTKSSTLIDYNCEEKIKSENVLEGVCHSPKNEPALGITCCPYQRYGYDICPASSRGQEILNEAYLPLFESGIDYAQILDQNHGGGQYMCYAKGHNHPPMPGKWMTENMQKLLDKWNEKASPMIFGCESAAAEPFIGNLLMSDNRFELNYPYGTPVPLYAFIYHEYVRNFMGNQCGCPFEPYVDTLRYRLAYSFSIGDIMTLILAPNGDLMTHWGTHDFEHAPDMEKTLLFIKNMIEFYNSEAKEYLHFGKMSNAPDIECEKITIPQFRGQKTIELPRLLSSTWETKDGKTAYIVVNPENEPIEFKIEGACYKIEALNGLLIIK